MFSSRIDSWRLTEDSTLLVRAKTGLSVPGSGALPVLPEQKDDLTELLQERCEAILSLKRCFGRIRPGDGGPSASSNDALPRYGRDDPRPLGLDESHFGSVKVSGSTLSRTLNSVSSQDSNRHWRLMMLISLSAMFTDARPARSPRSSRHHEVIDVAREQDERPCVVDTLSFWLDTGEESRLAQAAWGSPAEPRNPNLMGVHRRARRGRRAGRLPHHHAPEDGLTMDRTAISATGRPRPGIKPPGSGQCKAWYPGR
jgi:hypothetical protein